MIFWIMLVGVCSALKIEEANKVSTNIVYMVLAMFCFTLSIYLEFFLVKI